MSLRNFSIFNKSFKKQRVLVTGGSGFLGGSLVDCLLELGADVHSLSFQKKHPTAKNILLNWEDKSTMERQLTSKEFDFVFNCGGYVNPLRVPEVETKVINNHFLGTSHLIQCLNWKTIRYFFHLGSGEEYGFVPSPQSEDGHCVPVSPYGLAKLMTTQYCIMQAVSNRLPIIVGRAYIVYGPKLHNGLCHHVLSNALQNKKISLSPGLQKRDFIHVDDFLCAVLTIVCGALQGELTMGEIFNIASGQPRTVKEFVEICCELADGGKPFFGELPYRMGEPMEVFGAVEKMQSKLKWSAQVSLAKGLSEIIRYWRQTK